MGNHHCCKPKTLQSNSQPTPTLSKGKPSVETKRSEETAETVSKRNVLYRKTSHPGAEENSKAIERLKNEQTEELREKSHREDEMKEAGRFTKSEYQNSEMYDVVLPEATSGRRTAQNSRHSVA